MLAAFILSAAATISRRAGDAAVSWAYWQKIVLSSQFSVKPGVCSRGIKQLTRRSLHSLPGPRLEEARFLGIPLTGFPRGWRGARPEILDYAPPHQSSASRLRHRRFFSQRI